MVLAAMGAYKQVLFELGIVQDLIATAALNEGFHGVGRSYDTPPASYPIMHAKVA